MIGQQEAAELRSTASRRRAEPETGGGKSSWACFPRLAVGRLLGRNQPTDFFLAQRATVEPQIFHPSVEIVVLAEADPQRRGRGKVVVGRVERGRPGHALAVDVELEQSSGLHGGDVPPARRPTRDRRSRTCRPPTKTRGRRKRPGKELALVDGHRPHAAVGDVRRGVEPAGQGPPVGAVVAKDGAQGSVPAYSFPL